MKLPFLNRTRELGNIKRVLLSSDPAIVVLYGRRRCGKSRLLNELPAKNVVYHLADQSEPALQRSNLAQDISRHLRGFADVHYPTWEALFTSFFARAGDEFPPTLVLDEFPYLVSLTPSLPSTIQKFYDKAEMRTHLILCGSSQRMMHGLVLDSSAPLYGRSSLIQKIRPLEPGWIRSAFNVSGKDALEVYSVWGGIPRYWEAAQSFGTLREMAEELIFNRDGLFHQEPHRLLLDDLRSDVQPHSLLSVIAGGSHRLSEIAARLEKRTVGLSHPLNLLIDLGFIKRELPFGESIRSTKRSLYRLNDPFLQFWYRFVYPHMSLLEQDVVEPVIQYWQENFATHAGMIWEDLARKSVPHLRVGGIQWKEASRWWGRAADSTQQEIDVVAESMDGKAVLLGEVKWASSISTKSICNRLTDAAGKLPFCRGRTVVYSCWIPEATKPEDFRIHVVDADQVLTALQ